MEDLDLGHVFYTSDPIHRVGGVENLYFNHVFYTSDPTKSEV